MSARRRSAPQLRLGAWVERELVVDLFAGGGGASEARVLRPEIAQAIRALVALDRACEIAERDGVVVPMRKAGAR